MTEWYVGNEEGVERTVHQRHQTLAPGPHVILSQGRSDAEDGGPVPKVLVPGAHDREQQAGDYWKAFAKMMMATGSWGTAFHHILADMTWASLDHRLRKRERE